MNKRKHFLSLATFAVAAVLIGNLTSCGDDDGESIIPSPKITDSKGQTVQVTSFGGIHFAYSEDGKLKGMSDGNKIYTIEDDKFTINISDEYSANIYLGSDGLITKIEYTELDPYGKVESTMKYDYNSDRRLESASISYDGSETYHGETSTYNGSGNTKFTWKDGNLAQVEMKMKETAKDDGESYSGSYTANFVYTYGKTTNPSKQFPFFMADRAVGFDVDESYGGLLCVLGLFGYGPAYLPTSCNTTVVEEEEGKSKEHTYTYAYSFTQNSNGTLSSETRDGKRYDYGYGSTRSEAFGMQSLMQFFGNVRFGLHRHGRQL